jgi:hypothetical protein
MKQEKSKCWPTNAHIDFSFPLFFPVKRKVNFRPVFSSNILLLSMGMMLTLNSENKERKKSTKGEELSA